MSRAIAIVALGCALGACTTSLPSLSFLKSAPPTEVLRIESDPPGAEAKSSQGPSCRTPCELRLQAGGDFSVTVSRDGYQPQTVPVALEAAPAPVGPRETEVVVAAPRFEPNPVYVELVPTTAASAAPSDRKQRVKKPKPKAAPVAARPAATPQTTTASSGPASVTLEVQAPTAQPAASATNFPWPSR